MSEVFSKTPLGEIADLFMGQSPDSRFVHDGLEQGLPFLQGNSEFGEQYPEPIYSCAQPARTCKAGDVLISVRAPVGEVNLADTDYCIGRGLAAIRFHKIPPTLGRKLVSKFGAELRKVAQGTTFEAIGRKELASLNLLVPPIGERNLIAQILDTLDTQIRQTEVLIAKLERIKQGLLTDLLARGIDQNGELRPTPDQAPRLYKDSPLGRLPKEWEVDSLGGVSEKSAIGPFGSDLVADDYQSEGVPVVFVRDVKASGFRWLSEVYVSTQKARSLAAHQVLPGDVLLSKMGLPPCVACLYPKWMPSGIITADIIRFRPNTGRVLGEWVTEFVNSEFVLRQVRAITAGVTRPKVTLGDARNIFVGVPPLSEQSRVLKLVSSAVTELDAYRRQREQLEMTKQGLMDDLLTGRVRVTPLLETKEQATA